MGTMAESAEAVVRAHIQEWDAPKPDLDRVLDLFTDDAVWWDAPMRPAEGKAAIRERLQQLLDSSTSGGFEIVHFAVAGDVVMTERIDRFTIEGVEVALPVCGVAEVRDGKIAAWRDYWDLRAYKRQLAQGG